MGGGSGPHKPVYEPTTDSRSGKDETGNGAMLAPPRHRFGLDAGGLSADPQRRCSRHRRRHRGRLRSEPGGQSSRPPGTHQVRPLPRAAGPPGLYPESGRLAEDARHSNVRGQGGATRRDDGAGGNLRAGLPVLFIRLPAGTIGPPGVAHSAERALGQAPLLGARCRHTQVLRLDPALSPPSVPRPASHGRRHPTDDRQMAESRSGRRRSVAPYDRGLPARGCHLTLPLEHLPAPCAGRVVRDRGEAASQRGVHPRPVRRRCADGVRQHRRRRTRTVSPGQAPRTLWTYAPPRQDAPRRLPPKEAATCASSANGWDRLRFPSPDPCLGTVSERQGYGSASDGKAPVCTRRGRGRRLVSETPPLVPTRPASPLVLNDAGPLCLLWRRGQQSAFALVRQSSRADLAQVVVAARSSKRGPMGPLQRAPQTTPAALSQDCSRLRRHGRTSLVKNRMREIRTSGSVRGGDGNVPTYSAILHQISGLYTCPLTLVHFCG